jgi:hypothetical protein
MRFRSENDRERLAALTSVKARGGSEAVSLLNLTGGAANSRHLSPPFPRKPDGLFRKSRKQLICEFPRVKTASVYELTT